MMRREVEHAADTRRSGIRATTNQSEDAEINSELCRANQIDVSITLNIRGLWRLRPGVTGLSENVRFPGVLGRLDEARPRSAGRNFHAGCRAHSRRRDRGVLNGG